MFNLGYLPGSDKSVVTCFGTTSQALNQSLDHLAGDGAVSVIAYRGHEGGNEEYESLAAWVEALSPEQYFALRYERWSESRGRTPVLFWIQKRPQ